MEEMELDKIVYYLRKLELHKRFGKVFGKIPLPNGIPFYFQLFLFFVVFFIEVNIGTYFILPILQIPAILTTSFQFKLTM